MNRWVKRGLIAIPVLVALFFGAIFLYAKVLNDSPSALSEADLSEAVAGDETTTPAEPGAHNTAAADTTDTADTDGHRGHRRVDRPAPPRPGHRGSTALGT